jgi:alkanesulfonate monooxygenase SsuD/methylene tetrahydromethanopterin reductase-like flavin-dependent oxidoreductase (luciferase family)
MTCAVACSVRSVRPLGTPQSVGVILPTIPWKESPAQDGHTLGNTPGGTQSATERIQTFASEAERAGVAGLWACDHLLWHLPLLEPLTSLAVAATATRIATLGTCVLQLPLRQPTVVARQAATLQLLSEGRFVLGVGVGSHPGEYEAAGARYSQRGRELDAGVRVLRQTWGHHDHQRYRMEPRVAPIPIWFGGSSSRALDRTALAGDGWVPLFIPATDYSRTRARLLEQVCQAGRDPATLDTAVVVLLRTGKSIDVARRQGTLWLAELYDLPAKAFDRHLIAGDAQHCAESISAYHEAGASHVIVLVAADQVLDHLGPVLEALPSLTKPTATTNFGAAS